MLLHRLHHRCSILYQFEYQLKVTGAQQANGLLARLTQAGVPVVLFNLREPSLHEIFVETVGGESDA